MYRRSNPIIIKSVSSKYLSWIWAAVLVGVLINGCLELVIKEGDESPRTWLEAIHSEDRDRVLEAALTKQVSGEYDEKYRIVRPDGSIRWIRDRAFPVKNEAGNVYRIAGIAEDITGQR